MWSSVRDCQDAVCLLEDDDYRTGEMEEIEWIRLSEIYRGGNNAAINNSWA